MSNWGEFSTTSLYKGVTQFHNQKVDTRDLCSVDDMDQSTKSEKVTELGPPVIQIGMKP